MEGKQGLVGHLDFDGGQDGQPWLWLSLHEREPSTVASLSFPFCRQQSGRDDGTKKDLRST